MHLDTDPMDWCPWERLLKFLSSGKLEWPPVLARKEKW